MKKLFVCAVLCTVCLSSITIGDGIVIPACSVVEVKKQVQPVKKKNIDTELEDYVIGVVAGEMSPDFPYEALKAQAVAARTYAVRAVNQNPNTDIKSLSQNYITISYMKKRWGSDFDKWYNKIKGVVYDTAGEIVEYDDEPILAAFYSTSCGQTEECQNVWTQSLPYLKSVSSEGDVYSPYYSKSVTVSKKTLVKIYGSSDIKIESKTPAGYVKNVNIGGKSISANEIRSCFGLRSTAFDIVYNADNIVFNTKGYGHGVGMSQYGACYMANNGSDYKEILLHYYPDTSIIEM